MAMVKTLKHFLLSRLNAFNTGMRLCCGKCGFIFENIPDDRPDFGGKQEITSHANTDPGRVETVNPLMPYASMNTDISFTGRLA